MAQIELTSVFWSPVPESPQLVSIYVRRGDLIDIPINNQLAAAAVFVGIDGSFSPNVIIDDLDPAYGYYIKAVSLCNNSVYEQLFNYNELVGEFSLAFSLDFTS